jgi:Ca2+/H+ antiporter
VPSPGFDPLPLLLAKIVVSVGFVLLGTAAAERLGPRLGGLIAATPQMAVVSLIFFALEQGHIFAAESSFCSARSGRA